jgi:formylglycine-generating enzyme required for sulfatase activity
VKIYEVAGKTPSFMAYLESKFNAALRPGTSWPFDHSVGFLVGVGWYPNYKSLKFVNNDIDDMREFLLCRGGFDRVYEVTDADATRELVEAYMMNTFRKELTERDRLLFYFSGHGADFGGETGYLLLSGYTPDDWAKEVLPIERIREWIRVIGAKHILLILDACASGSAFGEQSRGTTESSTEELVAAFSGKGSRTVVTAGTGGQLTYEDDKNGHGNGVFTRAFLNAVNAASAPAVQSMQDVFARLSREVAEYEVQNHKELRPQLWALERPKFDGSFVFINTKSSQPYLPPAVASLVNVKGQTSFGSCASGGGGVRVEIVNNLRDGLEYAHIPSGEFTMGCVSADEANCDTNEKPAHKVRITRDFYMTRTEITVAAYALFVAKTKPPGVALTHVLQAPFFNPGWQSPFQPVVDVKWSEAQDYCRWANGDQGRLPTEAEWEWAARGGSEARIYPWGDAITPREAKFHGEGAESPVEVCRFPPNPFGLYDMAGNVAEWTADSYAKSFYTDRTVSDDPLNDMESNLGRTVRGGSWDDGPRSLRNSARSHFKPDGASVTIGFRCVTREMPSQ